MILDTLDQWPRYATLSPRLPAAFRFLETLPADLPDGRHPLDGDNVFALVQTYQTKTPGAVVFEAHRTYLDIQFLQRGAETILWAPLTTCGTVTEPYRPETDAAFFAPTPHHIALALQAGQFAMFFPTDAHAPGLVLDQPATVRKIVIKVRL